MPLDGQSIIALVTLVVSYPPTVWLLYSTYTGRRVRHRQSKRTTTLYRAHTELTHTRSPSDTPRRFARTFEHDDASSTISRQDNRESQLGAGRGIRERRGLSTERKTGMMDWRRRDDTGVEFGGP
jgi:hypothetical protein